ncbi:MAG: hypothetical protein CSB24_04590 [Deltaproteobacteria bacterium]|nr:MAG: hypothetical protein CSB24_04590 [Deltaproteobacteria bacterium]
MKKIIQNTIAAAAVTATLCSCAGPATKQGKGTAVGAGVGAAAGAALGQAIGRDQQATLWGAGIGAVVGGLAGNQIGLYMDHQEQELRNAVAASEAASIRRSQDVLTATFKSDAYFDYNSSVLKPGGQQEMSRVAAVLNKYPHTSIQVSGHTDSRGSAAYNQQLSQRRAEAVKNALVQRGVNPSRIHTVGYGETQPIAGSDAMNRRVEITITPMT